MTDGSDDASFNRRVARQMNEQPDYWPFMFTYAYDALKNSGLAPEDPKSCGLNREQIVLYLSGVSAILGLFKGQSFIAAKDAFKSLWLYGWDLSSPGDPEAIDAYFQAGRSERHEKTQMDLVFTNSADPQALFKLSFQLDSGTYGFDHVTGHLFLPALYTFPARSLLGPGGLPGKAEWDSIAPADDYAPVISARYNRRSPPGRDGDAKRLELDIDEVKATLDGHEGAALRLMAYDHLRLL